MRSSWAAKLNFNNPENRSKIDQAMKAGKRITAAIDLGSKRSQACWVDEQGEQLAREALASSKTLVEGRAPARGVREDRHAPRGRRINFDAFSPTNGVGILSVYLILIGVTGSILVFKSEAVASPVPASGRQRRPAAVLADISETVDRFRAAFPKKRLAVLNLPSGQTAAFQMIGGRRSQDGDFAKAMMFADGVTGRD